MTKSDIYTKWFYSGVINKEGLFYYLQVPEKYRGEPQNPQEVMQGQLRGTPNQKPDRMVLEGPNQQIKDEAKRKQQSGLEV